MAGSTTRLCVTLIAMAACGISCSSDDGMADEVGDTADATDDTDADAGTETGEQLGPTWHQDIAPLVAEKCSGCHQADGIAPFSMQDYTQASVWAPLSHDAMVAGQMPPWGQENTDECQPRFGFLGDNRFTSDEKDLFAEWVDAGTPEGDPLTAAPVPDPPATELLGADHDLPIAAPIEIGPGADQLWCFVLDPGLTEDAFIDGVQIMPGNSAIVHHALVYVDAAGESEALANADGRYECFGGPEVDGALIAVWAPGAVAQELPDDVAMRIPAGAKLVVQIHYHPTGADELDPNTAVVLRESDEVPLYVGEYQLPGNLDSLEGSGYGLQPGPNDRGEPEFRIPADVAGHTERMTMPIPPLFESAIVWQASSHMHYLGTNMRMTINRFQPEPGTDVDEECFIETPHYDFGWQRTYRYDGELDELPTVRPGDVLILECEYDNTLNNPNLGPALADQGLDAPIDVVLGEESLDEMCLGVFGIATPYEP